MGMFDYVLYRAPCYRCGQMIGPPHWQSKDGPCELKEIEPGQLRNGDSFYTGCPECGARNEYKLQSPPTFILIPVYED